ncbi:MAG TPA: LacI family transcriptional regulator [Firmicutes bacterium]|jgi:DNA-binding LacI/PurR family transcriptional regulator|nr:LacI family transcriptional regulator [Bacillota bacterium]
MEKPTINMIAARAGVSIATVSMVLNEKGHISEETRHRVKRIVHELGYRRRQKDGTIGIASNTPAKYVTHLLQAASEHGYALRRFTFPETETCDCNLGVNIAGVIVYGGHWNPQVLDAFSQRYPTVLMGGSIPYTQVDSVWVDSIEGIGLAVSHLITKGHRSLALINGPADCISSWEKAIGFERAVSSKPGLGIKTVIVEATGFRMEHGRIAARRVLEQLPDVTGIIASDGNLGFGALEMLRELHIQVPDDISLVVFRDAVRMKSAMPPLTAIGLPEISMAREVILHLVRRIQDPYADGRRLLLKPTLVERDSVATLVR